MPHRDKVNPLLPCIGFGWFARLTSQKGITTISNRVQKVSLPTTCHDTQAAHQFWPITIDKWLRTGDAADNLAQCKESRRLFGEADGANSFAASAVQRDTFQRKTQIFEPESII